MYVEENIPENEPSSSKHAEVFINKNIDLKNGGFGSYFIIISL